MDKLQQIRDKFSKGKKLDTADAFVELHHHMMKQYGWIPIDEFKRIPIPTMFILIDVANKDAEQEKRQMDKAKARKR
jgi:hypothetical protein